MNEKLFDKWKHILLALQDGEDRIRKTQGYTGEAKRIEILRELVKEQTDNESTDTTISAIR